jgi:hypothetical protein
MVNKTARLLISIMLLIMPIINLYSKDLPNGLVIRLLVIFILVSLGFAVKIIWDIVKQPLPAWSEDEIKRWEVIREKGERQYLLSPVLVVPIFFILYGFLFINWDATRGLLFNAGYCAFAGLAYWLIYLTRKGLWSLREKTYKALQSASPMSDNALDHNSP